MRVLDLFSGVGGFSLGLERAGMQTVAFCEIEPFCRAVLRKHWPEVPIYEDIRTLTADVLERDGIAVDVICGGFPCQDLSFAGKRAGLEGERSGLWGEYRRLIGELRPRFVIVENVPGLLSLGMGTVLGDLAALGYDAVWDCIPASALGAPHRRDRLWIVAHTRRAGDGVKHQHEEVRPNLQKQDAELADAVSQRRQGPGQFINPLNSAPNEAREAIDAFHGRVGNFWSSEPLLGRSLDGFPNWLDRHIGEEMNGPDAQARAAKELRNVWSDHVSKTLFRAVRGHDRIQQAEILYSFVRELQSGSKDWNSVVEGAKASEELLRSLRARAVFARPSHRPGPNKQPPREPSDAVQALPQFLAHCGQEAWACRGWEDAIPRVSTAVPNRAHRLKALGNAVVPQIPELIGRAIMEAAQ